MLISSKLTPLYADVFVIYIDTEFSRRLQMTCLVNKIVVTRVKRKWCYKMLIFELQLKAKISNDSLTCPFKTQNSKCWFSRPISKSEFWIKILIFHADFLGSYRIEHQFLSGIRDLKKAGSLWGIMRGVGGERKSTHQSWLAKRVKVRITMLRFSGSSARDSVIRG